MGVLRKAEPPEANDQNVSMKVQFMVTGYVTVPVNQGSDEAMLREAKRYYKEGEIGQDFQQLFKDLEFEEGENLKILELEVEK